MALVTPSWFKQRQGKAEPAGDNTYQLTAPNLKDPYYITIRRGDNGLWAAAVRTAADGPDLAATPAEIPDQYDAWEAAFELYRRYAIV